MAILGALGGFMNNINWQFIDSVFLTVEQYNSLIDKLRNKGLTRIPTNGKRLITGINKLRGHYFLSNPNIFGSAKNQLMLYVADPDDGYGVYCVPTFKEKSMYGKMELQSTDEISERKYGYAAYEFINQEFKNDFGVRLDSIYSNKQNFKELYWKIKKCVFSPINYITNKELLKNIVLTDCFKSDESSSYPAKLVKDLPTLYGCEVYSGRVEPTEEFPFAFYVNSGHLKIYGELDSREFNNKFYPSYNDEKSSWHHDDNLPEELDQTILCKKCIYNMSKTINRLYEGRKENPQYKDYMNMCIGYFHTTQPRTGPICSHLASVVMARCIKSMIERAEHIEKEGNSVLLINTDAVCWMGKQSTISVPKEKKSLGAFVVEHENCEMIISGVKKYQIKDGNNVKTVCSGLKDEIKAMMKFGDIINYDVDISYWTPDEDGKLVLKTKKL